MNEFASAARVVHVLLLALGIGAAAQLLMMSDALSAVPLQHGAQIREALRAQLDGFMLLSAPVLLVTLGMGWVPLQAQLRPRVVGIAALTILSAVSGRWLNPALVELQDRLGRALDGLPSDAPGTADWTQLSAISHAVLLGQLAVAVVLLLLSITSSGPKRSYAGIQL